MTQPCPHPVSRGRRTYQEVAGRKVVPDQTLDLTTEPPGPVTVVWTATVIENGRPANGEKNNNNNNCSLTFTMSETFPSHSRGITLTCRTTQTGASAPRRGETSTSEPKRQRFTAAETFQCCKTQIRSTHVQLHCSIPYQCACGALWLVCPETNPTG